MEKEKSSKSKVQQVEEVSLEKLILDTTFNKYDAVLLARRWAYELKAKEGETRTLQDLISVSIRDILGIQVDHKMVFGLPHVKSMKKPKAPANPHAAVLENLQRIGQDEKPEKAEKADSKK